MNSFHDQKHSVLFCIETSYSFLSGAKGGRGCGRGKEREFVKCNMSCFYVCCKKETTNKKKL